MSLWVRIGGICSKIMTEISLFKEYAGAFNEAEDLNLPKKNGVTKPKPNFFILPYAVGKRDAKEAWLQYTKARINGAEAEMLHAGIVGKARDMLLAQKASALELGLHPFVYSKAKAYFRNWKGEELQNFYDSLVFVYHDARMSGVDLDTAIEKALLTMGATKESKKAPKMI